MGTKAVLGTTGVFLPAYIAPLMPLLKYPIKEAEFLSIMENMIQQKAEDVQSCDAGRASFMIGEVAE